MYIKYNILCRLFASDYRKRYNMNMKIEDLIKERIEENKKLFNSKELNFIANNINIIKKVYLIGLINGKNIYE